MNFYRDVGYNDFQDITFRWRSSTQVSSSGTCGDEYIIEYDDQEGQIGGVQQLARRDYSDSPEWDEFLKTVFISKEMKKFLPLSELESKKYSSKVEMQWKDWMFGSSDSRKSESFSLDEIPENEAPNEPPQIRITSPSNNSQYESNAELTFQASVTDPEGHRFLIIILYGNRMSMVYLGMVEY